MSPREIFALRDYLGPELKGRTISDARRVVSLTDILEQTCLVGRFGELSGRSVLLAVSDQLISALAMTEIDGVARRMLLCPPDLNADHVQTLIDDADIDAIVTDQPSRWADVGVYLVMAARPPERRGAKAKTERATEWLMLTSGTSGVPKIVGHTLEGLTGAIVADGSGPRRRAGVGDLLRHQALRRPSDPFARHHRRRFDGADRARRAARRSCRAPECEGRHAYIRHAVALAQASDERIGLGLFSALRPAVGRDCRSGRARWSEPGLSRGLDRSCLCVDRGRRRLCRQRRPRGLSRQPGRAEAAMASK